MTDALIEAVRAYLAVIDDPDSLHHVRLAALTRVRDAIRLAEETRRNRTSEADIILTTGRAKLTLS